MGFYRKLEDKYYGLMDWFDKKGVPVYKAIDAIESNNIPSFPFFVLFCILVIAGLYLGISGIAGPGATNFFVQVTDSAGNPISGATVNFVSEETGKVKRTTGSEGKAGIEAKLGEELKVVVEKEGFEKRTLSVTVEKAEQTLDVKLFELGPMAMKFQFFKAETSELIGEDLVIAFSCSDTSWDETEFVSGGIAELEIPRDCGEVIVSPADRSCTSDCAFDLTDDTLEIYLEGKERGEGIVYFSVYDESKTPVAGIDVSVLETGSTIRFDSCTTALSGGCSIDNLPLKRYWVRATDSLDHFVSFDSSSEGRFVEFNESRTSIDFGDILLNKGTVGEITIVVVDKTTGEGIENASVSLYDKSGLLEEEKYSDAEGKVVFNIAEAKKFDASIDASGYILKTVKDLGLGDRKTVELTQATSDNSQSIEVMVLDERDEPIENVKLYLKKAADYSIVGNPVASGADGKGVFRRVEDGTYVVYAERIGFKGKTSGEIEVRPRVQAKVTIKLLLGRGSIKLKVLDPEQQPVQGASIQAFDFFTDQELTKLASLTGVDGVKEFSDLRADKRIYFVVKRDGFSSFTTVPIQVTANSTAEKTVSLDKGISKFEVKFVGLYLNGEKASELLDQGIKYKAVLHLRVPEGSSFTQTGIHLRTGEEKENSSNPMEKDSLYIKRVTASAAKIVKGTSFTPSRGYATDSRNLTSSDAKWANIVFGKSKPGIKEVEAEIQVRENASLGQTLEIHYRGWGLAGSYLRHPEDNELRGEESTSEKQALYAEDFTEIYHLGPTTLCNDLFCAVLEVEDLETRIKSTVIDQFPAEISSDYRLSFRLTSVSENIYSNSEFEIESKNKGLELRNYEVKDVSGQRHSGNAQGYSLSVPVGELRKGLDVQGWVELRTKKEGTSKLALNLLSENEKRFNKTIKFQVSAAQGMVIETIPLVIIPFVENDVLVKVNDEQGEGISEARVKVYINDELVVSGNTDLEGVYKAVLEGVAPGTVIRIEAEKNGFKSSELEINVNEEVLSVMPASISESFRVNKDFATARDLLVKNETEIPLRVIGLNVHGPVTDFISFNWKENYIGREVTKESDLQLDLKMKMKQKAKDLTENSSFKGTISIVVESDEFSKQFVNNIPVTVSIGLAGSTDSPDCLELTQSVWKIATRKDVAEETITLLNTCTSDEEPIPLRELKAKVVWLEGNPVGEFSLGSDLGGGKRITLGRRFQEFAPRIGEDSEAVLRFSFNPDVVKSAAGKAKITVEATNPTDTGEEEIETVLEVIVYISDLTECVSIEPDVPFLPVTLTSFPFNTGYNLTSQYFGYQPGLTAPYYSQAMGPNYTAPPIIPNAQMRFDPYDQLRYPYNGYRGNLYDTQYYNPAYSGAWGGGGYGGGGYGYSGGGIGSTGRTSFKVINNCEAPIELALSSDSALMVKPSSSTVKPKQEEEIEVTSTYFIGDYGIKVKAGIQGSEEKKTEIASLRVRVQREDFLGQDCIILDRRVFQFNDFFLKGVEGKIINQCYSTGWSLDYYSITVPRTEFVSPLLTNPYYRSGMIRDIQVIGLNNEVGPDGKPIQVLRFRIWKDPGLIRTIDQGRFPTRDNPLAQIGVLRIRFAETYYLVDAPEVLLVSFMTPQGARQSIPFDIRLQDFWAATGLLEDITWPGRKDIDLEDCINKDALQNIMFHNPPMNEEVSKTVTLLKTKREDNACGSGDSFSLPGKTTFRDGKDVYTVKFSKETSTDVKVTLRKENPAKDTTTMIENKLEVMVDRVQPSKMGSVDVPFKIMVHDTIGEEKVPEECKDMIKEKEIVAPKEAKKHEECWDVPEKDLKDFIESLQEVCGKEGQLSGNIAFKNYGLDKLLFEWGYADIEKNECDEIGNGNFCDAAQYMIGLDKKMNAIKEYTKQLTSCMEEEINNVPQNECKKDSGNMFRFAKKTIKVTDDVTGNKLVFFLNAEGKILESTKKIKPGETTNPTFIRNAIEGTTQPLESIDAYLQGTEALLAYLESSGLAEDIVIELTEFNEMPGQVVSPQEIGADLTSDSKTSAYNSWILTFNEFKEFHQKLKESIKNSVSCDPMMLAGSESPSSLNCCNAEKTSCFIKMQGVASPVYINVDFLKEFYSRAMFKIGIRNKANLSKEDMEKAIRKGKDTQGLNEPFEDFYYHNIEVNSFLIRDAFTEDFKGDFYREYGKTTENVSFNPSTQLIAGKHRVFVDYTNWNNNPKEKFNAVFTLKKSLATLDAEKGTQYSENYFLQLPFDGTVGVENNKYKREGYGYAFLAKNKGDVENIQVVKAQRNYWKENGAPSPLVSFTGNVFDKFTETKKGKLLHIKGEEAFNFAPSDPVELTAKITGTGPIGLFYKGDSEDSSFEDASHLFNWISEKGEKIADEKKSMDELCKEDSSQVGFTLNVEKSTNRFWAMTFLPTTREYRIGLKCTKKTNEVKETATVYAYEKGVQKDSAEITGKDGQGLKIHDKKTEGYAYLPLNEMVQKVKSKEVCISPLKGNSGKTDGVELWWNPSEIATRLDLVTQQSAIDIILD